MQRGQNMRMTAEHAPSQVSWFESREQGPLHGSGSYRIMTALADPQKLSLISCQ